MSKMTASTAGLHAMLGTVAQNLASMAEGDDDAMTRRCLGLVNDDPLCDKQDPTTTYEKVVILDARGWAGLLQSILLRLLHSEEAEYPDSNDEDGIFVEMVLQDYCSEEYGEEEFTRIQDALRCSIDAKTLRMWLKTF